MSLNRMRCKTGDGETWTTVRVKDMRERLGLSEYNSTRSDEQMISLMKAAERLGICIGSAKSLVLRGILPATQIVPGLSLARSGRRALQRGGAPRGAARDRTASKNIRRLSIR